MPILAQEIVTQCVIGTAKLLFAQPVLLDALKFAVQTVGGDVYLSVIRTVPVYAPVIVWVVARMTALVIANTLVVLFALPIVVAPVLVVVIHPVVWTVLLHV